MEGFSSTEITIACSGEFKYKPTMSTAFAANSGSVHTHQLCSMVESENWTILRRIDWVTNMCCLAECWARTRIAQTDGIEQEVRKL
jgi:hypothetical protein